MCEQRKGEEQSVGANGSPDNADDLEVKRDRGNQQNLANAEIENDDNNQLKGMLQRVQADFINYKRRAEEDRTDYQKYSNARLILKLLPVLDEFNLAMDQAGDPGPGGSWTEGVKLIRRKIESILESEKVAKIDVEGKEFNPLEHEAMSYLESKDHKEGQILSVVREGYKLHDRVIRPALVVLAKKPESEEHPIP